jgi:predicted phosphate transport protein (TIGR00153 family)
MRGCPIVAPRLQDPPRAVRRRPACDNLRPRAPFSKTGMPLLPREGRFFDYFNQHAALAVTASRELVGVFADLSMLEAHTTVIHQCEKQADKITHDTVHLLHQTFITPFDRDQIHGLVTAMDDVLDLTEDVAECLFLYDVRRIGPEAQQLAAICVDCTVRVKDAVAMLSSMKNSDAIIAICGEIDRLESHADQVFRAALAKLFREEPDAREVIKQKEVFQLLEEITDRCEDVANLIEGIVLESA